MEPVFNIDSIEEFKSVVDDITSNLHNEQNNVSNILNDDLIIAAKQDLRDIIFNTHCNSVKIDGILSSKGCNAERIEIFSSIIEKKQNELMFSTLLNYNSLHGPTVATFDWCVKLIYGVSELKKLKYPLMQLAFTTVEKGKYEQTMYDVKKQMLTKMINVLESLDLS